MKEFVSPEIENNTIEELSRQLLKANNALKKLQEEREIMFANISHDLRAPMTAIRSALDLAFSEQNPSPEDMIKTLELIDRRAKTLESLINDMYYLYRIGASKAEEVPEEIEAAALIEEYFYDLQIDSKYDDFVLKLDVKPESECVVRINVQEIIRVLDNIFSNAARYSGKGSTITLSAGKSADGKSFVITVEDNGCGIPEDKLPYVFLRTYTVSDSRTPGSDRSGSGLGLAIAKAIIEKHNGTIECESKVGEGTRFIIGLPVEIKGN